jgi:type II secretory pathway component PulF
MTFYYIAINAGGEFMTGRVEADSETEAINEARKRQVAHLVAIAGVRDGLYRTLWFEKPEMR